MPYSGLTAPGRHRRVILAHVEHRRRVASGRRIAAMVAGYVRSLPWWQRAVLTSLPAALPPTPGFAPLAPFPYATEDCCPHA